MLTPSPLPFRLFTPLSTPTLSLPPLHLPPPLTFASLSKVPPHVRHVVVNKKDAAGASPLFGCVQDGDISLAHFLLAHGTPCLAILP